MFIKCNTFIIIYIKNQFSFPSLNNGINFQSTLIPIWKSNNSFCELIEKIPNLINNIEEESNNNLFSNYGTYSKTLKYNVNDFLENDQNKLFKIQKVVGNTKKKHFHLEDKYLIITDVHILILCIVNEKYKNECRIESYNEIINIKIINEFQIERKENEFLEALNFEWINKNEENFLDDIIIKLSDKADLIEIIMTKKALLISKFNFFLNNQENDVKVLSDIINIKEKILENNPDDFTLRTITELYQKIIEIYSKNNNNGFEAYIKKLHDTIEKYDKMKSEKNNDKKQKKE